MDFLKPQGTDIFAYVQEDRSSNCFNDFLALLGNHATWQTCADMADQQM
jgi:hypothetical protein